MSCAENSRSVIRAPGVGRRPCYQSRAAISPGLIAATAIPRAPLACSDAQLARLSAPISVADPGAGPHTSDHQPLRHQPGDRRLDGVSGHAQVACERAGRRQQISGSEIAAHNRFAQLLIHLHVERCLRRLALSIDLHPRRAPPQCASRFAAHRITDANATGRAARAPSAHTWHDRVRRADRRARSEWHRASSPAPAESAASASIATRPPVARRTECP